MAQSRFRFSEGGDNVLERLVEIFGETIVLSEGLTVNTEVFASLFSDCEDVSCAELLRVDTEKDYGYAPYIEQWKEQGLIE